MLPFGVRQKTLKTAISCSGTGLHSGAKAQISLKPAAAGTGIVFRRMDMLRGPGSRSRDVDIPADWRHVVDSRLCTVIGNAAGATVGTIEHLMAALFGAEIDNLLVEIDGAEVPVMDGSAAPFLFLIECAGVVEQEAPRRAIEIVERAVIDEGKRSLAFVPGSGFSIGFEIDFDSEVIARQQCLVRLTPGTFKAEISRARTFGFAHEIGALREAGLVRGGSLDNAVVISGDQILNRDGLRYEDEFVRHKILDCVGDLYLAGAPIIGHVQAVRSGHKLNNQALRRLFARPQAWRYVDLTAHRAPVVRQAVHGLGTYPAAGD